MHWLFRRDFIIIAHWLHNMRNYGHISKTFSGKKNEDMLVCSRPRLFLSSYLLLKNTD